jgi:fibro-slime domain-containing protein
MRNRVLSSFLFASAFAFAAATFACSSGAPHSSFTPDEGDDAGAGGTPPLGGGDGGSVGHFGGDGSTTTSSGSTGTLTFIVHDFKLYNANDPTTNPDFENVPKADQNGVPSTSYTGPWPDPGIVEDTLGADGLPQYKSGATKTLTTHGKAAFDQWYRDVPGTNIRIDVPFTLTQNSDGSYGYDSQVTGIPLSSAYPTKQFFPIDDSTPYKSPFGQQGLPHNYSFTVQVHTRFTYLGGEFLHYRGDDDVWVFIDSKRVIDLGGIHDPETGDVQLDKLGLTKGQEYPLDFFFAERHVYGSNVLFTTSLKLRDVPK